MNTSPKSQSATVADERIIELYWERNENAIKETDAKYGPYLLVIANNIVHNKLDSEECLNDTYLGTWNRIPPTRPVSLQTFLARIMRNIAVSRFRKNSAERRIPENLVTCLDELDECVPAKSEDDEISAIAAAINDTLAAMSDREQYIFVCRYYYADKLESIAASLGVSTKTISRTLSKLRSQLRIRLSEAGFEV